MRLCTRLHSPIDWEFSVPLQEDDGRPAVSGQFRSPAGEILTIPAFLKKPGVGCVRFAPTISGDWTGSLVAADASLDGYSIAVQVEPGSGHFCGPLRIDRRRPRHFCHADGTPFHLLGYELNWLWALDAGPLDELLSSLATAGFNYALINCYAFDTKWCPGCTESADFGPPPFHPWLGEHGAHDYSRLNPTYWAKFDAMLQALLAHGLVAHLYFKVYNKLVDWPAPHSAEEDLYFDHIVDRYQAFPNVVWDFSKEAYYEPDKAYLAQRLQRIRARDAYSHLVTVHDDKRFSYADPGRSLIDFVTDQNHRDHYFILCEQRRHFAGPILNAEYAYEHGPDSQPNRTWGENDPVMVNIQRAYEVAMAGGYCAHYYTNHAWDVIRWRERSAALPAYRAMREFLTEAAWREFEPAPLVGKRHCRVMFGATGDSLLLYASQSNFRLSEFQAGLFPSSWAGEAMDILTGARAPMTLDLGEHQNQVRSNSSLGSFPFIARLQRASRS